ncbi:hypothetical protein [Haemophilus haemolyticus]|uniref:hypothetical protein n=1 Tax=Haemophilus haemolyticus TaxID=726 RepID=UPI000E56BA64|nr:hypothetical protein [Haemophilus haemolyticus]
MSQSLEDKFHQHIVNVYNFLKTLKFIYDEFGMEEMLQLVDPSIDDLERIVTELKKSVELFDTQQDLLLQNRKISLQQSLLEAERLLIAVRKKDQESFDELGHHINPRG